MSGAACVYRDRFGYDWTVRFERGPNTTRDVTFNHGRSRLVVSDDDGASANGPLSASHLKELFCDAERVLEHGGETWYVGYRHRSGKGGQVRNGVSTRFRSAAGEVRYAGRMLHFRQMDEDTLCEHLTRARPVAPPTRGPDRTTPAAGPP